LAFLERAAASAQLGARDLQCPHLHTTEAKHDGFGSRHGRSVNVCVAGGMLHLPGCIEFNERNWVLLDEQVEVARIQDNHILLFRVRRRGDVPGDGETREQADEAGIHICPICVGRREKVNLSL
jgi:hypothetical protein